MQLVEKVRTKTRSPVLEEEICSIAYGASAALALRPDRLPLKQFSGTTKLIDGRGGGKSLLGIARRNRIAQEARNHARAGRRSRRRRSRVTRLRPFEGQNVPRTRFAFREARASRKTRRKTIFSRACTN